jgi:hypothetical protein
MTSPPQSDGSGKPVAQVVGSQTLAAFPNIARATASVVERGWLPLRGPRTAVRLTKSRVRSTPQAETVQNALTGHRSPVGVVVEAPARTLLRPLSRLEPRLPDNLREFRPAIPGREQLPLGQSLLTLERVRVDSTRSRWTYYRSHSHCAWAPNGNPGSGQAGWIW